MRDRRFAHARSSNFEILIGSIFILVRNVTTCWNPLVFICYERWDKDMYVLHRNNIGNIGKSRHTCTNRAIATRCDKISKNGLQTHQLDKWPDVYTKTACRYVIGRLRNRATKKEERRRIITRHYVTAKQGRGRRTTAVCSRFGYLD